MRRDWILGLGAISTLAVLVGLDLLIVLVEDRSLAATHALLRGLAPLSRSRAAHAGRSA